MNTTTSHYQARSAPIARLLGLTLAWLATPVLAGVVQNTADSGPGSLRLALTAAAPGETITFAPALSGATISLTSGELLLDRDLTIDASSLPAPVTIDAGTATTPQRVLRIDEDATVVLDSLVLTGGHTVDASHPFTGKYKRNPDENREPGDGGGVHNAGTLTMRHCVVRDNTTGRGGDLWLYGSPGGSGGGIHNEGTMTVEDCLITGNTTGAGGRGIGGWYDGIDCENSSSCYFDERQKLTGQGGSGGPGAGLCNTGTVILRRSTISANATGGGGEGIDGPDELPYDGDIDYYEGTFGYYYDEDGEIVDFDDYYDSKRRYQDGGHGGMGGPGGGIANEGELHLERCNIAENTTGRGGDGRKDGAPGGPGAGLSNEGHLEIVQCSFAKNFTGPGGDGQDGIPGTGGSGAALEQVKGSCLLEGSAIVNNRTAEGAKFGGSGSGVIMRDGGMTIRNATIAGNQTGNGGFRGGSGAGVFHLSGHLVLEHATIAENTCGEGGSYPGGVGGLYTQDGRLEVRNSIISNNAAGMGDPNYERWQSDVDFEGRNLVGGNPGLASLGFHGGPTRTMPPLPGSPAIDGAAALPGNPVVDQRGFSRPMGGGPDLGAVESGHQTGYHAWTATGLPGGSDTDFDADPDGDGWTNALTYACGADGAPTATHSGQASLLSFGFRPEAQMDTVIRVLHSTDLVSFSEVLRLEGGEAILAAGHSLDGSSGRLVLRDGSTTSPRAFYRLEVTRLAP